MNPPETLDTPNAAVQTSASSRDEQVNPTHGRLRWLNWLDAISLFYVVLPALLFISGYLIPLVAWPIALGLAAAALLAWRQALAEGPLAFEDALSWRTGPMTAMTALVYFVVACTGIGAFTFQFFDYAFYNAVLRDFMEYDWPLAYQEAGLDGVPLTVVIYAAYWLPASMVGGMMGWGAANYFQYGWSALGVLLIAFWFLRIAGTLRVSIMLMLLFFGGLDIVGRFIVEGGPVSAQVTCLDYLTGVFWWSESRGWLDHWSSGFALTDPEYAAKAGGVFFRFYSPLSFLVDGPQHIVPGVLAFLMAVHDLWRRKSAHRLALLWGTLPLSSIFVAAGSLPFLALGIWEHRGRRIFAGSNLMALPSLLVIILYFMSVTGDGRVSGWLWEFQSLSDTWQMLLLHYVVEFGLLAACVPILRRQGILPHPLWWIGTLCFFFLAPWYRIGEYNDFASKVIIPAQFVFLLWIAIGIVNADTKLQKVRRMGVIALLFIGALGPLGIVARAFDFGLTGSPPPKSRVRHMNEVEPRVLGLQGQADMDAFFWRYLAKPPVRNPSEPIYSVLRWDFLKPQEPIEHWIYFVEPGQYSLTDHGLTIKTKGNRPILRRDGMELDTRKIGMVKLDVVITVDGKPASDVAIVVQWATQEQAALEAEWPFQRWYANQAYPVRNIISTNSYWRGTVEEMAFYLRVPEGDEREYEVTIREIEFLER